MGSLIGDTKLRSIVVAQVHEIASFLAMTGYVHEALALG
jgi:hypothetical protein